MNLTIRKATIDDIPAVRHLLYNTWLATYVNDELGVTQEVLKEWMKDLSDPAKIEAIKKEMNKFSPSDIYVVAHVDDELAGMCKFVRHSEGHELKAIYVLPKYQKIGIGLKLWQEVLAQSPDDVRRVIVHVVEYNQPAISFYRKLGFVQRGGVFYQDRYIMPNGVKLPLLEMVKE